MKRNEQVVNDFFNGTYSHSLNVYSSGDNLINYNTIMVHFEDNTYYVNIRYYSHTTSKIQSYIKSELMNIKDYYKIIYYYGDSYYGDNYKEETRQVKTKAIYNLSATEYIGIDNISMINCNNYHIQFYRYYNDILIGDCIDRKIKEDKKTKADYFRYNKEKIYLNDLQLIGINKIIELRNDIKEA